VDRGPAPVTAPVRLAIDSATDRLSVAVGRPGAAAVELSVTGARQHAAALPLLLDRLLERSGAGPADIALVAVSGGPGGFTGLRVGIAVAKALVAARNLPLHTAPSLLVRAAGAACGAQRVLAVTGALRGEVYAGAWRLDRDAGIQVLFSPRAVGPAAVDALPEVDCLVGDAPPEVAHALRRRFGRDLTDAWPAATTLLGLVDIPGGAGRVEHPDLWEPDYGRPAEAQVQWERRHGRSLGDATGHTR
jgi:tRNA threonylcarbamoyladenosine biosynthesis protein TsaB